MANNIGKTAIYVSADHKDLDKGLAESKASISEFHSFADKAAKKKSGGDKDGGGMLGGAGKFLVSAAALAAVWKFFDMSAKYAEEVSKKLHELQDDFTSVADKAAAIRLGILPENVDDLERANQAFAESGAHWQGIKSVGVGTLEVLSTGWNTFAAGFRKDVLGLPPVKVADPEEEKRFRENLKKKKAAVEDFVKTQKEFNDELAKDKATIGMTDAEKKLYDVKKKLTDAAKEEFKYSNDSNRGFILNGKLALVDATAKQWEAQVKANDAAREAAELAKKNKEAVKDFHDELTRGIATVGKSGDEQKLFELKQKGATDEMLRGMDALAKPKKLMEDAFSLVEKTPVDKLREQIKGLNLLWEQGAVSQDEFRRAAMKAAKDAMDAQQSSAAKLPSAFAQGSKEAVSFINNYKMNAEQQKPILDVLDEMKKNNALQQKAVKALDTITIILDNDTPEYAF